MPETGPIEVRRAADVFNEMQRRIQQFVEDRVQMVAAISHDLRAPITRLRLRTEFMTDIEQRQKMLANLDEMETMISSTLDFVRDEASGEPREIVDVVSLTQRVCDDFADAGHDVSFNGRARLGYSCQPSALRRALSNLIDNAVKYGEKARVEIVQTEHHIVIRIDDDGPGIPKDDLEKVFAPFRRVEHSRSRETGGTGLGLSVARTIVRAHGGDVTLSNLLPRGLRAEVMLPTP